MNSKATAAAIVAAVMGLECSLAADAQAADSPSSRNDVGAAAAPDNHATAPADASAPAGGGSDPNTAVEPSAVQGSAGAGGLETVFVTARRTAENSQTVPVSISAFSADDLHREQINAGQDLQGRVPSLVVSPGSQQRGVESPSIRGQGSTLGSAPGVIIYYDEVPVPSDYFSNAQGGPGKFFDLQDLQVLKGPQGTLFGKNTTGGALLLEPQVPKSAYSSSLEAETGSYNGRGFEAVLNQPLVSDSLLLRVGLKYQARDGYTRDVVTGVDYDSQNYLTARLGLTWRPTDSIENYLLAYYTSSDDHGTSDVIEGVNSDGINALFRNLIPVLPPDSQLGCKVFDLATKSTNCGQDIVAQQQARGIRQVQLSANPNSIITTGATIDKLSYKLNDLITLRNIASWSFMKYHYRWDQDGSYLALDDQINPDDVNHMDQKNYTEELQLQGTGRGNHLKYIVGGYYDYLGPAGAEQFQVRSFLVKLPTESVQLSKRSLAPYLQTTYNFGDLFDGLEGMSLTAGGRYTKDKVDGSSSFFSSQIGHFEGSAFTYTAGLDYKLNRNLFYGKVSRGYKSGGFEPTATSPRLYDFQPEFVTNYEIGQKSDFSIGDMPARINSAVYYSNYSNMQRPSGDLYAPPNGFPEPGEAIYNAGKAMIAGFEFDGTLQPLKGLSLLANYSYTYGKYQQFDLPVEGLTPQLDCSGQLVPIGGTAHMQCMPFTSVPRHQFSLGMRYRLPIPTSLGIVDTSATYAWTDRNYSAATTLPEAEPGAWLGSYGVLNASANWSNIGGSPLSLRFYGTNLTDRTYRISNSNVWSLLFFQSSIYGEPRMLGLSLSYAWGD